MSDTTASSNEGFYDAEDGDECPLCAGVGEIEATTERSERDTVECPFCIARETADREKVSAATITTLRAKLAKARDALINIKNGEFNGISDLATSGSWQAIATQFQRIAAAALKEIEHDT